MLLTEEQKLQLMALAGIGTEISTIAYDPRQTEAGEPEAAAAADGWVLWIEEASETLNESVWTRTSGEPQ